MSSTSTTKRHRQSSSSSSSSTATPTTSISGHYKVTGSSSTATTSSKSLLHPAKASRIVSPSELSPPRAGVVAASAGLSMGDGLGLPHPILCTLPPTCIHRPTPLANTKELETHYATCHAHVCEQRGCGCVFPEARLLELHFTECHDPLAAVRKDRGEKIFACHLPTCNRLFMTPKTRRLHLIQGHGYPKEYFFAVTNKGVGGLLRKWGEGASMIRKEWKPRNQQQQQQQQQQDGHEMRDVEMEGEEEDSEEEEEEEAEQGSDDVVVYEKPQADKVEQQVDPQSSRVETEEDALTRQMNSLTLVPNAVRFGRGGKRGGFVHGAGQTRMEGGDNGQHRGLGWRGRGRAGIMRGGRGRGRSG